MIEDMNAVPNFKGIVDTVSSTMAGSGCPSPSECREAEISHEMHRLGMTVNVTRNLVGELSKRLQSVVTAGMTEPETAQKEKETDARTPHGQDIRKLDTILGLVNQLLEKLLVHIEL